MPRAARLAADSDRHCRQTDMFGASILAATTHRQQDSSESGSHPQSGTGSFVGREVYRVREDASLDSLTEGWRFQDSVPAAEPTSLGSRLVMWLRSVARLFTPGARAEPPYVALLEETQETSGTCDTGRYANGVPSRSDDGEMGTGSFRSWNDESASADSVEGSRGREPSDWNDKRTVYDPERLLKNVDEAIAVGKRVDARIDRALQLLERSEAMLEQSVSKNLSQAEQAELAALLLAIGSSTGSMLKQSFDWYRHLGKVHAPRILDEKLIEGLRNRFAAQGEKLYGDLLPRCRSVMPLPKGLDLLKRVDENVARAVQLLKESKTGSLNNRELNELSDLAGSGDHRATRGLIAVLEEGVWVGTWLEEQLVLEARLRKRSVTGPPDDTIPRKLSLLAERVEDALNHATGRLEVAYKKSLPDDGREERDTSAAQNLALTLAERIRQRHVQWRQYHESPVTREPGASPVDRPAVRDAEARPTKKSAPARWNDPERMIAGLEKVIALLGRQVKMARNTPACEVVEQSVRHERDALRHALRAMKGARNPFAVLDAEIAALRQGDQAGELKIAAYETVIGHLVQAPVFAGAESEARLEEDASANLLMQWKNLELLARLPVGEPGSPAQDLVHESRHYIRQAIRLVSYGHDPVPVLQRGAGRLEGRQSCARDDAASAASTLRGMASEYAGLVGCEQSSFVDTSEARLHARPAARDTAVQRIDEGASGWSPDPEQTMARLETLIPLQERQVEIARQSPGPDDALARSVTYERDALRWARSELERCGNPFAMLDRKIERLQRRGRGVELEIEARKAAIDSLVKAPVLVEAEASGAPGDADRARLLLRWRTRESRIPSHVGELDLSMHSQTPVQRLEVFDVSRGYIRQAIRLVSFGNDPIPQLQQGAQRLERRSVSAGDDAASQASLLREMAAEAVASGEAMREPEGGRDPRPDPGRKRAVAGTSTGRWK